jgi:hypothetical protein
MRRLPPGIPLFLDLSSPPLLTRLAKTPFFFSGGHPLSAYVTHFFRAFPVIDTSGANVTFASLSLAECLGASVVELYGADFSYPKGKLYTRPAYLYPYFHRRQDRFRPVENFAASFLYGAKSLRRIENDSTWYYETRALGMYREKFEQKVSSANIVLNAAPGEGAAVKFSAADGGSGNPNLIFGNMPLQLLAAGKPLCGAKDFLETYRKNIGELPLPEENITIYQRKLSDMQRLIFTTLLPAAAAVKYRCAEGSAKELLSAVKDYCITEISRVCAARSGFLKK